MSSLDYLQWEMRAKRKRWDELREVLKTPWTGDRGWEGRTIGLHLPLELRNYAIEVQERLQLRSMKEVLFKALVIGLKELRSLPVEAGAKPSPYAVPAPPPTPKKRKRDQFEDMEIDESDSGLDEDGDV